MSLKPYPLYKNSGVDWLNNAGIPYDWQVWKLGRLVKMQSGDALTSESIEQTGEFPVFGGGGFRGYTDTYTNEGHHVLIGRQGALCGNIKRARGRFFATEHSVVTYPRDFVDTTWLAGILETMDLGQYSQSAAQPGISVELIGQKHLPVPSHEEQRRIGAFLDRETAEIDAFIADQEDLIALLNERRAATIAQAVIKGLDPTVQMKDSGIDWLGKSMVPKNWTIWKLGRLVRMRSGDALTSESIESMGTYPVYGGGGFRGYTETYTNNGCHVLIGRQGALCGNVKRANGKFFATEHAIVAYPQQILETTWLAFILEVMNLGQYSQSAAQPGLSVDAIAQKRLPVPPIAEQEAIVRFLNRVTAEIAVTISDALESISLSKERRAALISAAVTGKIDVRDAMPVKHQMLEGEPVGAA